MNTIRTIVRKEFLHIRRDRKMLPIVIIAPVLQLVLLGYAANLDVRYLRLAVHDDDRSPTSRALAAEFLDTDYFVPGGTPNGPGEIQKVLVAGVADLVLVIPAGFEADTQGGREVQLQVLIDGSNSTKGTASLSYAASVIERFSQRQRTTRRLSGGIELEPRVWFNPELETRNFMVPGVLALILMVITMMLSSLAIVKEKELGTLEQINVTPIRPGQLIVGKLMPFVLIGFVDVVLVVFVARVLFGVPFRGSLLFLLGVSLIFVATTLGLGLLISSISRTQQQAMMTSVFFVMMPMIFLSGFAFPIKSMPAVVQYITYLLPLRYYFVIIRGIFLKGVGLAVLWEEVLALTAFGIAAIVVGAAGFKKRSR